MASSFVLRSVLFVPGTRPDRFASAFESGADAVVLDLEDAVDAARKDDARQLVGAWLAKPMAGGAARLVRVNAAQSPWIGGDLAWLSNLGGRCDAIVVPKVESPEELERIAANTPSRPVIPLLETARGVLRAAQIVAADADIPAVLFGAEDLTAQIGVPRTLEGEELLFARSQVVLAAVSVGADPIDAVLVDLASPDRLRRDAARARALGFTGKMAIHPDQVSVINEAFSPTPEEVAAARKVVDADQAARARGEGVFRLDGRMVDAPVVIRAKRVLALAVARPRA